jgi:hypothetical protein
MAVPPGQGTVNKNGGGGDRATAPFEHIWIGGFLACLAIGPRRAVLAAIDEAKAAFRAESEKRSGCVG